MKKLRLWYNNKPYAILALEDSRTIQCFDVGILGYNDGAKSGRTLKFEILEVYPGSKYGDTVIAELYFDGIDVHWPLRILSIQSYLRDAICLLYTIFLNKASPVGNSYAL